MCLTATEVELREQDLQPRLVHRREPGERGDERSRDRWDAETIFLPIPPEELYDGRHRVPETAPSFVEIFPPHRSCRGSVDIDVTCGAFFLVVEENLVKQRRCSRRHRCRNCNERYIKESEARKRKEAERRAQEGLENGEVKEHGSRRHHRKRSRKRHSRSQTTAIFDLIDKLADFLQRHTEKDEELRHLRETLQKVKAEERSEGRKLDHIEKLLRDVATSPVLSSPTLNNPQAQHPHSHPHEAGCACSHCHPPCAPPSTPATWHGPYGCEPPRSSIPAGRRTHQHHERQERNEHRKDPECKPGDPSLEDSQISNGSGGSGLSSASKAAKDTFDKFRKFVLRQGRKMKAMDAKIDAANAKIDVMDAQAQWTNGRVKGVESGLAEVGEQVQSAERRIHGTERGLRVVANEVESNHKNLQTVETGLEEAKTQIVAGDTRLQSLESASKTTNSQIQGLGLRLDDSLARTEVLGAQMKQVETRASMAQRSAHHLDGKVNAIVGRETAQADGLRHLTQRVATVEGDVEGLDARQRRDERVNEHRWRRAGSMNVLRGYMPPMPRPWRSRTEGQGGVRTVEVEYEEEIDIERTERVRREASRSGSRSKEQRRGLREPGNSGADSDKSLSYTRKRVDGKPGGRITLSRK